MTALAIIISPLAWTIVGMIVVETCRLGRFWDLTMTPFTVAIWPVILIAHFTQRERK